MQETRAVQPVRETWLAVTSLLKPHRQGIFLGLLAATVNRISLLLGPVCVSYMIDTVLVRELVGSVWPVVGIMFGAALLEAASARTCVHFLASSVDQLIADLRNKLQAHLLRLPVTFYDRTPTGELLSRLMNDTEVLHSILGTNLSAGVSETLYVIVAVGYLLWLSPRMTAAIVPFLLFGLVVSYLSSAKTDDLFLARRRHSASLTSSTNDTLGGIRTLKIYRAEEKQAEKFRKVSRALSLASIRSKRVCSTIDSTSAFTLGSMGAVVMYIGARQVLSHGLSIGNFAAYAMVLWSAMWPLLNLVNIVLLMFDGLSGLGRVIELFNEPAEEARASGLAVSPASGFVGRIEMDRVSFCYDNGVSVLRDITFSTEPGSVTAIVGTSGAGKSTIMSILAGLYTPSGGTVLIDGVDLSEITLKSYRRQIALVQQTTFLFPGTIRQNVLLANPSASEEELTVACRIAGVERFVEAFAEKLNAPVGERGILLSGGQQQRISIARALLAKPMILLMDEASASLDLESEAVITEALSELMFSRTTIVVAHRLSTIRRADQILVLDKGRIVERGTHDWLQMHGERYRALYEQEIHTN